VDHFDGKSPLRHVGKPGTTQIEERISNPLVRIDNDLAVVWAPFDFLVRWKNRSLRNRPVQSGSCHGKWMIASVGDSGTRTCSAKLSFALGLCGALQKSCWAEHVHQFTAIVNSLPPFTMRPSGNCAETPVRTTTSPDIPCQLI
jgi:hypothetical protein